MKNVPATPCSNIEDLELLGKYLQESGRIKKGENVKFERLRGGVSNRTIRIERPNGDAWVMKQALPKLRVNTSWFSDPARIEKEALGMIWLSRWVAEGTIPELLFLDLKNHLLAMRAVPSPHENWKTLLMKGVIKDHHVKQFGILLANIHKNSFENREAQSAFGDRSFFRNLRLEPYYAYTADKIPEAAPFFRQLIDSCLGIRIAVVHGDYSPKNVLVYKDRLILLDHEVIHYGDPAFDIGFSMTHFLSKANHLPEFREMFRKAAQLYCKSYFDYFEAVSEDPFFESRCVSHTLACLMARISGRSPLEYLCARERHRQMEIALGLTKQPPGKISELINEFVERL